MKIKGWKKVALVATTIVAVTGAVTALQAYTPWAPKITFAIAAENKLVRLDNKLVTLIILETRAKLAKDTDTARSIRLLIRATEREISEMEKLKEKHK